jgi:hypothetical protein
MDTSVGAERSLGEALHIAHNVQDDGSYLLYPSINIDIVGAMLTRYAKCLFFGRISLDINMKVYSSLSMKRGN